MCRMLLLTALTANSLHLTEKMISPTDLLNSNIQGCGLLKMIRLMKKRTQDNIRKKKMTLLKLRSNKYWVTATMNIMMRDISLRTSWEELLRKTQLPLASTSKQVMEDIDSWWQILIEDWNSNQAKCKQAAAQSNYSKYRTIVIWVIKGNQLMIWSSLVLEKKSKGELFVSLPKNKSRSLLNIKMSQSKPRL